MQRAWTARFWVAIIHFFTAPDGNWCLLYAVTSLRSPLAGFHCFCLTFRDVLLSSPCHQSAFWHIIYVLLTGAHLAESTSCCISKDGAAARLLTSSWLNGLLKSSDRLYPIPLLLSFYIILSLPLCLLKAYPERYPCLHMQQGKKGSTLTILPSLSIDLKRAGGIYLDIERWIQVDW